MLFVFFFHVDFIYKFFYLNIVTDLSTFEMCQFVQSLKFMNVKYYKLLHFAIVLNCYKQSTITEKQQLLTFN